MDPDALFALTEPPRVGGVDVASSTSVGAATFAAPTTSGAVPNALLSTTRRRSPPIDGWTISRSV